MKYQCLKQKIYTQGQYVIGPLSLEEMMKIKVWRNQQMKVLRQNEILTDEHQVQYYEEIVKPTLYLEKPPLILFGYWLIDDLIGYGGLTHVDWVSRRAEISFLLKTERTYNIEQYCCDFSVYLTLLEQVAFEDLKFHRLFTETYDIRTKHIQVLEDNDYQFEGRLKEHVLIEGKYVDSLIHGCLRR